MFVKACYSTWFQKAKDKAQLGTCKAASTRHIEGNKKNGKYTTDNPRYHAHRYRSLDNQ